MLGLFSEEEKAVVHISAFGNCLDHHSTLAANLGLDHKVVPC